MKAASSDRSSAEEQGGWQFGSTFGLWPNRLSALNRGNGLTDRLQKLYADQVHISSLLLTLYPGLNRRHSGRNQSRGGNRGSRDGQGYNFVHDQRARTGNKST